MFVILRNLMAFRSSPNALSEICLDAHIISSRKAAETWNDIPKDLINKTTLLNDFTIENIIAVIDGLEGTVTGVVTTDELAIVEAAIATAHINPNFGSPEKYRIFRDKLKMKAKLDGTHFRIPCYEALERQKAVLNPEDYYAMLTSKLGQRLFIKPVEGAGSEDVAEVNTVDEFVTWLSASNPQTHYEVDEFIVGTYYHIDAVLVDGHVVDVVCFRHAFPNAAFFDGKPLACIIEPVDSAIHGKLAQYASEVVGEFPELASCGVVDIDCCVQEDSTICFMEIAARAGGGMTAQMFQIHTGVNSEELHFRLQMNLPYKLPIRDGDYAGFFWYPKQCGDVVELVPPPDLESTLMLDWKVELGEKTSKPKSIRDTSLAMTVSHKDPRVLETDFDRLCRYEPVSYSTNCRGCTP